MSDERTPGPTRARRRIAEPPPAVAATAEVPTAERTGCGQRKERRSRAAPAEADRRDELPSLFQLPPGSDPRLAALSPDMQEAFAHAPREVVDEFFLLESWDRWEEWQADKARKNPSEALPLSEEERALIRLAVRHNPPWLYGPAEASALAEAEPSPSEPASPGSEPG